MGLKKVLVIDDNPVNLKITSTWISRAGCETSAVVSAEEALELLPSLRPDLILTDIQLPGMDGLEFARRVKASPEWRAIPVVALTALESKEDEVKIREAGCEGYLVKPVNAKTLADLVKKHLSSDPKPAPPPPAAPPAEEEDSLESLRAQFLSEGAEKCRALVGRVRAYLLPRVVAPLFDNGDFRIAFHQWAGLGGSLGFPQITTKAREAEALLTQPITQMAPRLKQVVEELLQLFTAGQAPVGAPLTVPPEIAEALLGKRFALVNLDPGEVERLAPLLEKVDAFYRAVPLPVALAPKAFRAYDVVLANPTDIADACEGLVRGLADSTLPLVFLGKRELWPGAALPSPRYPAEFLASPWDARQALMCAATLIARKAELDAAPSGASPKKPLVLIADDDPIVRILIKSSLEPLGMECRVADNGQVALAMARNSPPDIAILDVNMPNRNGFEVLSSMRGYERTRNVRVMMLTGSQEEADITRGLSFGADEYVIKPFDPVELASRVKRLLALPR